MAAGGREPLTSGSLVRRSADYFTQVDMSSYRHTSDTVQNVYGMDTVAINVVYNYSLIHTTTDDIQVLVMSLLQTTDNIY